ncbi:hypothetical protein [Ensifer sp. SL37]|uniref:hypothetical protein n=1 Tax=Ensifer sp. SL37 TaxID=2995137 RepID=UPI002273071F|nr:hypothetical protein [Ensifer sp. SL37]MCY1740549.1 hypothetical protein [Ensifer sp. SL37]
MSESFGTFPPQFKAICLAEFGSTQAQDGIRSRARRTFMGAGSIFAAAPDFGDRLPFGAPNSAGTGQKFGAQFRRITMNFACAKVAGPTQDRGRMQPTHAPCPPRLWKLLVRQKAHCSLVQPFA